MSVPHQGVYLVHSCIILLLVSIELLIEIVSCMLLEESQVGGEVVDVVAHCLLFLM